MVSSENSWRIDRHLVVRLGFEGFPICERCLDAASWTATFVPGRSMNKVTKKGAKIEVDVIAKGASRATIIVREVGAVLALKIDEINISSEKERVAFVKSLGAHAGAAAILLQEAAAEVTALGDGANALTTSSPLASWPTEPWPHSVDGAVMLDETAALIRRFVVMDENALSLVALWTAHTHAIDAADCSPILALLSPAMRSGKTSLLQVLEMLVRDGVPVTNLTVAGLFRTVEQGHPTLLIDEADTFLEKNHELIGLLNKGHVRVGAVTIRNEMQGDSYVPRRFSLWAAKAIAAISRIPATLLDRSLVSPMRRKASTETVERIQSHRLDEFHAQRSRIGRWAADNLSALRSADPVVPADLNNREADSWRPLFAIADLAGGEWPTRARRAAAALQVRPTDLITPDIRVLSDIRDIFAANTSLTFLPTQILLPLLYKIDDGLWQEFNHGKPLTDVGLAKLLQPYGIAPAKKRISPTKTLRVYHKSDFARAWSQYLPPVEHPEHPEPSSPSVPPVPGVPSPHTAPANGGSGDQA